MTIRALTFDTFGTLVDWRGALAIAGVLGVAMAIIREIGVETGGSNIQFAVSPETGEVAVIEMNDPPANTYTYEMMQELERQKQTLAARRSAYSMLLAKGLIRVGIGIPASAEFDQLTDQYFKLRDGQELHRGRLRLRGLLQHGERGYAV